MESKQEIRKRMRQLNRALSPEVRTKVSRALWEAVEQLEAFRSAHTIALFSALPDEPDTTEALCRWSREKALLVPRVEGEVMHFYPYRPEQMLPGAFGIEEPQQGEVADPRTIDLIIVPGVAFTSAGDRMGRGKGFYAKYLIHLRPDATKVGVCYAHQVVASLPTEPHDIRMDRLICAPEP